MPDQCAWCRSPLSPNLHGGHYCSWRCIDQREAFLTARRIWHGQRQDGTTDYPNYHHTNELTVDAQLTDAS